jgi:NitT/TauT family transport system permease protein/putative hydroxymethylpyrimidine transport system permease protein
MAGHSVNPVRRAGPPLVVVAVLLGAWEAYADTGDTNRLFLPPAHAVAAALWNHPGLIASNLGTTAEEVGLGLALAVAIGLLCALAIHLVPFARQAFYPLAIGSQAIPVAVIAPLLVFWWGFGLVPKLFVIVLVCFFPVVVTTVDGLAAVDPDELKLLASLGATRMQAFRFGEMPAALPAALSGARIAVAVGLIGAVIAEISTAGTSSGLGHLIQMDLNDLTVAQTQVAWAATAVLFAFAIGCFYILGAGARALAPWAYRSSVTKA